MASIQKLPGGGCRVFIRIKVGTQLFSESQSFRTMREGNAWAAARETELRAIGVKPLWDIKTLRNAIERYRDEVTPSKRGERWEAIRLNKFLKDFEFVDKPLAQCVPDLFGQWRDARLAAKIKPNTVIREFGLLSAVFEIARREWRWVERNPLADVRRPSASAHRERVISRAEIKALLRQMKYSPRAEIVTTSQRVALAFLVALRTGMRQKELATLVWPNVYANYCVLPVTKTTPRAVPLAIKTLRLLNKVRKVDAVRVFDLNKDSLSTLFRKYRDEAELSGFTFHDSRHTAATWLAPTLPLLTLCKMFGWADPKNAMIYYNPKAGDVADGMDKRTTLFLR